MSSLKSRMKVLSLYKTILREAGKFSSYNFRLYALRRVRDGFRERKHISEPVKLEEQIKLAEKNLDIIKRQVAIGNFYSADKLVIEK